MFKEKIKHLGYSIETIRRFLLRMNVEGTLRYKEIVKFLKTHHSSSILEVGSSDTGISLFLNTEIVGADFHFSISDGSLLRRVCSDVLELSFKDKSFNYVIPVDMIEHLPKQQRKCAISEMIRVAKKYVLITFPNFVTATVYEDKLERLYRKRKKVLPQWLLEHRKHGLPSVEEIKIILESFEKCKVINYNLLKPITLT